MATIIQIKRSSSGLAPNTATLAEAELAYSQDRSNDGANAILYIESVDSVGNPTIDKVGGKYYTALLDAANAQTSANTLVLRDAEGSISGNIIYANSFVGNISGSLTGEAESANVANFANALTTGVYINLTGDVVGSGYFDGTGNAAISATVIQSNSVELGTDTTGDYVANLTPGIGIDVLGYAGESANLTVRLANTTVVANTYGGNTAIPVFVVDDQGRITSASNVAISTDLALAADNGTTDSLSLLNETLNIVGGTGVSVGVASNTFTVTNLGVTTIASAGHGLTFSNANGTVVATFTGVGNVIGTANEVEVLVTPFTGGSNVQIGLPNDVQIGNNLTVGGNLYVMGAVTTVQTATLQVDDSLVKFGNANPADTFDIGFYGEYVSSGNVTFAGLYRDADDSGLFKLFTGLTVDPTSNTVSEADFTLATLKTNITGGNITNLVNGISVDSGGTGLKTLTANAVLFGNGTSSVGLASGTSGQVLQINSSGGVVFGNLDGGTF